jgi:hypothetical protein
MLSIYEAGTREQILRRIESLQPTSKGQWGKMDVAQMMAHVAAAIDFAVGNTNPPRDLLGRVIGRLIKSVITSDKPFKKNSPTTPSVLIPDARDFAKEKTILISLVKSIPEGNRISEMTHTHPFFGELTPEEWGKSIYKHLDHHLSQFGA